MNTIEKEIALINTIIENAIDYGGDSGGPYCMDEEDLENSIENWLHYKFLDNEYFVDRYSIGYLTIRKKKEEEC